MCTCARSSYISFVAPALHKCSDRHPNGVLHGAHFKFELRSADTACAYHTTVVTRDSTIALRYNNAPSQLTMRAPCAALPRPKRVCAETRVNWGLRKYAWHERLGARCACSMARHCFLHSITSGRRSKVIYLEALCHVHATRTQHTHSTHTTVRSRTLVYARVVSSRRPKTNAK